MIFSSENGRFNYKHVDYSFSKQRSANSWHQDISGIGGGRWIVGWRWR